MDKFNTKHFVFLILATCIVSLKTYPTIFIRDSGRDSWVAMIVASIIFFAYFIYMIRVSKKNMSFDLVEIYEGAFGKTIGRILIGLFIITLFITLIESATIQANSMHTNMILETPTWYLLLFFVFPAMYTVKKDLVAIVIVTLIGITLIMISGINLGILTARYKDHSFLFPVFKNGLTLGFLRTIVKILGLYGCIAIVLPFLTEIKDKGRLILHSIIGLIIVIQMQIVSVTGIIATFEVSRAFDISYPKLLQTQLVSYARFLEYGELFVMLQTIGGWYLKYVITFYALLKLLKALGFEHKYLVYVLSLIIFGISYFITRDLDLMFILLNHYSYLCFVVFFIIPIAAFALYSFKGSKQKSSTY